MEVFYIFCVAILCTAQAQVLPLISSVSPCEAQVISTPPVVATTIVDNSVSNALANALQLLIVSNLIENTMNSPCGLNTLQGTVAPFFDGVPIQASVYSPAIDILTPDYLPYRSFEPVISPCDVIAPCEPVIDIIPNAIYSEVVPVQNVGCGCDSPFVNNIAYGNIPNIGGIGCGNVPSFTNSCGCGCNNGYSGLANIVPSILSGLSNVGCGCNNFGYDVNPFSPLYACDQFGPIVSEVLYPPAINPQVNCFGYGEPNYPVGITVEPWGYDSCPNRVFGNNYYY